MKKILIFFLAFGLLISCKSKENSNEKKTENRSKDDYQSKSDNSDKKETDFKAKNNANNDDLDEDGNSKADIESINGQDDSVEFAEWPQKDRNDFITSCVREAVKGGRTRKVATTYCNCMLEKIEGLYPDINVAARLTSQEIETVMSKYAKGCLK